MNKYIIITTFFLSVIGLISTKTIINNKSLFIDAINSKEKIVEINSIYNDNIAYKDDFLSIWSETQKEIGAELLDDVEYGFIIKDDTGNLYFPSNDVNVEKYAENLISLSRKIREKGTPFFYIQAPNKIIKGYSSDKVYNYNFSNKNADEFLKIIEENDVKTLDLRKLMNTSGIPQDKMFYRTDHHWTTITAFWAYKNIVHFLNQNTNLNISEDYLEKERYNIIEKKECFLGSLGRRVGASVSGYDDYTFIEPNFYTDYEIMNGITGTKISSGSFHDAIVKDHILNSDDLKTNKHATYFEWDYGDLIIKNKTIDSGVRVLLIKDSFALPVGAFLSTCVSELEMVDLRDTPKANLKKIIDEKRFDVVLLMYNTEVFNESMFSFDI